MLSAERRHLHKKGGYWFFIRRVPKEYLAVDGRRYISQSTKIPIADDPLGLAAQMRVAKLNATMERSWQDLTAGIDPGAAGRRYDSAVAAVYRTNWRTASASLSNPACADESSLRTTLAKREVGSETPHATQNRPQIDLIAVSDLVDEMAKICAPAHMKKSPAQRKRWRAPREASIATFIDILGGDRALADLASRDVRAFADFLQQRVLDGEIMIATANKAIRHAASMFRMINRKQQLELPDIFKHATIEGEKDKKRVMYEAEFIQEKLLAEGALAGVNPEARGVLYLMVETGIRPSEACGLTKEDIRLDCIVPHVVVADTQRELKSDNARRTIPLVGVSLMAMRANPSGFPRYWDRADSLSGLLNKVLQVRGLRPVKSQSLYSLRHSFESRLTVAGVDERVRAELMGHTYYREKYGDGGTLEFKRACIQRAALRPPQSV